MVNHNSITSWSSFIFSILSNKNPTQSSLKNPLELHNEAPNVVELNLLFMHSRDTTTTTHNRITPEMESHRRRRRRTQHAQEETVRRKEHITLLEAFPIRLLQSITSPKWGSDSEVSSSSLFVEKIIAIS